jgi:hypothetical protein
MTKTRLTVVLLSVSLAACASTVEGSGPSPDEETGGATATSTSSTAEPPAPTLPGWGEPCACIGDWVSGDAPTTFCCAEGLECLRGGRAEIYYECREEENICIRRGYCTTRPGH